MKTFKCFLLTLSMSLLFIQVNAQTNMFAAVDYMKLPEGGNSDYLKIEKEVWKPMHQEWVNQGKLLGWYLYAVPYPGGTSAEYHYVTVRLYDNLANLDNPMEDMEAVFKKVHPGKSMETIGEKTMASRDLVKTYGYSRWKSFGDPNATEPDKYLQMVSFQVPMDKWDDYREMETKYYHPTHQAEVAAGYRSGWAGWQLRMPFDSDGPVQFVAVDHYKDFAQATKPIPDSVYKDVFQGDEMEKRDKMFEETVTSISVEEWRLVDYVERPPVTTAKKD